MDKTQALRPYATDRIADTAMFTMSKPDESSYIDISRLAAQGSSESLDTASGFLRQYASSLLLNYLVVAVVLPADASKTLAQVQWVPRDGVRLANTRNPDDSPGDDDETSQDDDSARDTNANVDDYFASPSTNVFDNVSQTHEGYEKNASGYIQRSNVTDEDEGTKPPWVLPLVTPAGTWSLFNALIKSPKEGFLSLWKAQNTAALLELSTSIIQPLLVALFVDVFVPDRLRGIRKLPLMYAPNPARMIGVVGTAHALTTFLVSPLDLVRTRMIVQAKSAPQLYKNPLHALKQVFNDEGRWAGLYLSPINLVPTLLEAIARPLVHLAGPIVISRFLNIDVTSSPVSYAAAELLWRSAALLITQPLEVIRRRLQLQRAPTNPSVAPYYASVELRPLPYTGALDCAYRIATEEDAHPESTSTVHRYFPGLSKLYTGGSTAIGANLFVFLVTILIGRSDDDAGWTEV